MLAAILAAAFCGSAAAQQAQPATPVPPWESSCTQASRNDPPDCRMTQSVVMRESGRMLMRVSVRMPAEGGNPAMMLQLPHGLYLPDGVALQIDDTDWQSVGVQTCDAEGCYAGLPIQEADIAKLTAGKMMKVSFKSLARETIAVPVDLSGFGETFQKIR